MREDKMIKEEPPVQLMKTSQEKSPVNFSE